MVVNYRVYTKAMAQSPWHDTMIIESNKDTANKIWHDIINRLRYHSYKLEPITYGITINRDTHAL